MNVKINNKNYVVPQLGFAHMTQIEDMGFSVIDLFQKQKLFSIATAFTGVVTGLERSKAEELLQQHILGGGNLEEIYNAFMKATDESAFFKKFTGEKKTTKKTPVKESESKTE